MSINAMSLSMASKPSFYISDGPMSFVFTGNQPASPTPTVPDDSDEELDDATEPEADYEDTDADDEDDDDEDEEMDDDVAAAHEALEQLGLSDTEMADDSDADSNPPSDPSESEDVSPESGSEASLNDDPPPLSEEDDGEPVPPPPPHFNSPLYEAWLQGLTPNILFRVRIKPLIPASAIAAHTIRLWYRDFGTKQALLEHIVGEYQLMGVQDVSGYILKERRSNTWVEFGFDSWEEVMSRIRRRMSDEGQGIGVAVQAHLIVLVGGDEETVGIKKKGDLPPILASEEDPDL